jgi:DNA modification methylase
MTYTTITGDCLTEMRAMTPECVDLTVTSPPYDDLRSYEGTNEWEEDVWQSVIEELYRITKPGGVVVWVVGDATIAGSETGSSFKQALHFLASGFRLHDTMIYDKGGSRFPSKTRYYACFEYMFVFSKGPIQTVNLIRDRRNKCAGKRRTKSTYRQKDGCLLKAHHTRGVNTDLGVRFNIWTIPGGWRKSHTDEIAYHHPATFPERLAEDHIISWSNAGDLVFDPFMGSGTTGKMAIKNQRRFIGIERVPSYVGIARARLENVRLSMIN